ncbi:MAG: radical SAM protein [Candidatus Altiarchaeales archaeon]|nr:radical SAM protein [Candidatus Altiarchaeales archaeon]MBD3416248.1 radical SAM protein [Candidatus Altiarchaeales archaeon]
MIGGKQSGMNKTTSLCPVCLDIVSAEVFEKDGKMTMSKECKIHGVFESTHFWEDPTIYNFMKELIGDSECGNPDGLLVDVNCECNMNCPYCWVSDHAKTVKQTTMEELKSIISVFQGSSIYLSGGEPTCRADLPEMVKTIRDNGKEPVIFTNGLKFSNVDYALSIKEAGAGMIIFNFNSFDRRQCIKLYGDDIYDMKFKGLNNVLDMGIPVYLYVILKKGVNEDQINSVLDFATERSQYLRVIDFQTIWDIKNGAGGEVLTQTGILDLLKSERGILLEDFLQSTAFSHYFFEIYRKVLGRGGRRSPRCELRCYLVAANKSLTPITKVLDMEKLNYKLKLLNSRLDRSGLPKMITFLLGFPYVFLIGEFIMKNEFRRIVISNVRNTITSLFQKKRFPAYSATDIVSIMLGRFHDRFNVDLDFTKTCTFHAVCRDGKHESFCTREIMRSGK